LAELGIKSVLYTKLSHVQRLASAIHNIDCKIVSIYTLDTSYLELQ